MGRCKTCSNPARRRIERALLAGWGERRIAKRFTGLSPASVRRHAQRHLPPRLLRAFEAEEASEAGDLLAEARANLARERADEAVARRILKAAMKPGGDQRYALKAIEIAGRSRTRQRNVLDLLARLRGILDARSGLEPSLPDLEPQEDSEQQIGMNALTAEEKKQVADRLREIEELVELGKIRASRLDPASTATSNPNGTDPG